MLFCQIIGAYYAETIMGSSKTFRKTVVEKTFMWGIIVVNSLDGYSHLGFSITALTT